MEDNKKKEYFRTLRIKLYLTVNMDTNSNYILSVERSIPVQLRSSGELFAGLFKFQPHSTSGVYFIYVPFPASSQSSEDWRNAESEKTFWIK
jgi:hypothetical protein